MEKRDHEGVGEGRPSGPHPSLSPVTPTGKSTSTDENTASCPSALGCQWPSWDGNQACLTLDGALSSRCPGAPSSPHGPDSRGPSP